jgi:hypothetical protein
MRRRMVRVMGAEAGGILVFDDWNELWKFIESRREYVAIDRAKTKGGKSVYLARLTNDVCRLPEIFKGSMTHHYSLEGFAKLALMLRRQRQSLDAIRREYAWQDWAVEALNQIIRQREKLIDEIYEHINAHPVVQWVERVKGLGKHDAILFLGFIDPHIATSAGKAYKYWCLAGPESRLKSGKKAEGRPILRGEGFFMASRIWMRGDEYYRPLAEAKKEYYLAKLPADEKGRNAHAHIRALLWLARLLVGHAWEMHRRFERLPINPHANHIPPKPDEDAVFDNDKILSAIRNGLRLPPEAVKV